MRTNIEIDDQKMELLMQMGKFKTKKEAVDIALDTHLRLLKLIEFEKMRGENSWVGNLDEMRTYDKWESNV